MKKITLLISLFYYLSVSAQVANQPNDLVLCDDDNDGFSQFDLSFVIPQVIDNQDPANFGVSFYVSQSDADNGINPLPTLYTNTINPQTIYIRLEDYSTGNYDTTTFNLIVNPLPVVNIEDVIFCQGSSAIIDTGLDTSNYDFTWSRNGLVISTETQPTLTISQAGTYIVEGINLNTFCTTTSTFGAEFIDCTIDFDSDNVSNGDEDIDGDGNLENDDTDTDGIPNYLDNDDDGDNVLTIDEDYNNNGDPTDDDTNGNMIPDYLESSVALSINDFQTMNFNIFPNPAKTFVTIDFNSIDSENLNINVYDVQGKVVIVPKVFSSKTIELNTSQLSSGLYFVHLITNSNTTIRKLIIE